MKKFLFTGLFLMIIVALGGQPSSAQIEEIYGLVSIPNADVRSGPDFAYPTVGRIPQNSSVKIIGRAGDFFRSWDGRQWLQIEYGGGRPWIYARLVRTSRAFNSIPPTGRILPRNNNGRVPDEFNLSLDVCQQWPDAPFTRSGDFNAGDGELTVTYPGLQGANVYSVIVISPTGVRRAFDSTDTTSQIIFDKLPRETGTYTWRVAPYWTNNPSRFRWQQVCLLKTGGTFEKPAQLPGRE
ncbi:MAG: SH3 domain-containing protein [Chloroflexota bacterium]